MGTSGTWGDQEDEKVIRGGMEEDAEDDRGDAEKCRADEKSFNGYAITIVISTWLAIIV